MNTIQITSKGDEEDSDRWMREQDSEAVSYFCF